MTVDHNEQCRLWRQSNAERVKEYRKVHYQLVADRERQYTRTYRAAQYNAQGVVTAEQWATIVLSFGGLCAYCKDAPGNTTDHVIPLARGGNNDPENVVPACRRCNSSKGNRTPAEWKKYLAG